jgi:hypothetical protein
LFVAALVAIGAFPIAYDQRAASAASDAHPDFDGDGRGDLVVPVTGEAIAGAANVGAVHVFYGSSGGLQTTASQLWSQETPNVRDSAEPDDRFGAATAAGDFDGDGFDDLAIGAPGEEGNAGAVSILYGSAAAGLTVARNQLFWQNTPGIPGDPATLDGFGTALAAGDFDLDGRDDLAIGAPIDATPAAGGARGGTVTIMYGTGAGLSATGSHLFAQGTGGVEGSAELGDLFGYSLAAGDLDGDSRADLAIGAPREGIGSMPNVGVVHVLYGTYAGLSASRAQFLVEGRDGVKGIARRDDEFGTALTIGLFDERRFGDLAIGAPGKQIDTVPNAGAVVVIPGGEDGLVPGSSVQLTQRGDRVAGRLQANTGFGAALARGDFNGDTRHDLVIGAPNLDLPGAPNAGAVVTLYGGTTLLGGAIPGVQLTQDWQGVVDQAEPFDAFGQYLVAVDGNGDGRDGLFVGVPFEDVGAIGDAGAGHVFGGSALGLTNSSTTLWTQDTSGVGDSAQEGDFFGGAGVLG